MMWNSLLIALAMTAFADKDESTKVHNETCTVKAEVLGLEKAKNFTKIKIKVKEVHFKGDKKAFPQCADKQNQTFNLKLNYIVGKPELGKVYPFQYTYTEETTKQGSKMSESWRLDIKE